MTKLKIDTRTLSFSGHETFQCRAYWPKKGYDFIEKKNSFNDKEALLHLGVGKNMVSSIAYWLKSFGIIEDSDLNPFWIKILNNKKGWDPFLENVGTLWLLHYFIVKKNFASSYNLCFNHYRKEKVEFTKTQLSQFILHDLQLKGVKKFTDKTIDRDVNVLLKNYCFSNTIAQNLEDELSTLLLELELIEKIEITGSLEQYFLFNVNEKTDLPIQIFLYVILDLFPNDTSVELHKLETELNSPGLIFCINKTGLINKMQDLAKNYKEIIFKNDAGIIAISFKKLMNKEEILKDYYAG